jgi:hypothetical protein
LASSVFIIGLQKKGVSWFLREKRNPEALMEAVTAEARVPAQVGLAGRGDDRSPEAGEAAWRG